MDQIDNQAKLGVEGTVTQALPNATFRVKLDRQDQEILCHLAGKMRLYHIKVMPGDRVRVQQSPYDLGKGRIVYREK
jgi:translation initiation factor IF-1